MVVPEEIPEGIDHKFMDVFKLINEEMTCLKENLQLQQKLQAKKSIELNADLHLSAEQSIDFDQYRSESANLQDEVEEYEDNAEEVGEE